MLVTCTIACVFCSSCIPEFKSPEENCDSLSWQALDAVKKGNYTQAENTYQLAIAQAEKSNNLMQLPRALQELAAVYVQENKIPSAELSLRRALDQYTAIEKKKSPAVTPRRLDLQAMRVQTCEKLAAVLVKEGRANEAEQLYKETLILNEARGGSEQVALRIAKNYSDLLRSLHKNEQADQLEVETGAANLTGLDSLNREVELVQSGSNPARSSLKLRSLALAAQRMQKPSEREIALHYLGLSELLLGHVQQAESAFKAALIVAPGTSRHDCSSAQELVCIGACLEIQGKTNDAKDFYKRALSADYLATTKALAEAATIMLKNGKIDFAQQFSVRLCQLANISKTVSSERTLNQVAQRIRALATDYYNLKKYTTAESLLRSVLAIFKDRRGDFDIETAYTLTSLGDNYRDVGKYAEAEALYKRALAIYERRKGADTIEMLRTLDNLTANYQSQGNYAKAMPLIKRALAIVEKIKGSDDVEVANYLVVLANNYYAQGKYVAAEPLYKRALAIYETRKLADTTRAAYALTNFISNYQSQGKYAKATPLIKRALAIVEKIKGSNDEEVSNYLVVLANNYYAQGKYVAAEPLYKRALAIYETRKVADTVRTVNALNNFAANYQSQGDYAKAMPLIKRALAIFEKIKGSDNVEVANYLMELANNYHAQSKYVEAEPLYKRALTIVEKARGSDDIDVARNLSALATNYRVQGKHAEAQSLYKQALSIYQTTKGKNNTEASVVIRQLSENGLELKRDKPAQDRRR